MLDGTKPLRGQSSGPFAPRLDPSGSERVFEGAEVLVRRQASWRGIRAELVKIERGDGVLNDILSDSHVLFMGIAGKPHTTVIEAEGVPRWEGMKGQGGSSFHVAGRRMRSWHARGSGTILMLFFDAICLEELLSVDKAINWHSRPSTDEMFIAANGETLARAMGEDQDDLSALRMETIATSLQVHAATRFSDIGNSTVADSDAIERVIDLIHASFPRAVSLEELVAASGLSRRQLLANFRARTKTSPHQYIIRERLSRAQFLLATTTRCLAEVARDVGCANAEHLGRMFRQHLGMSPRAWQARNSRPRSLHVVAPRLSREAV